MGLIHLPDTDRAAARAWWENYRVLNAFPVRPTTPCPPVDWAPLEAKFGTLYKTPSTFKRSKGGREAKR